MRSATLTLAALAAAALLAAPGPARAQPSPKRGSIELGAGNYTPDVDSGFAKPGPYEQVFGGGKGWMFRAGMGYALYSGVGVVEAGFRSGYFRRSGKGIVDVSGTDVRSGDKTTFNIIPTSLTLTYRFDWMAEQWHVPLAPYARLAAERYNWWVTDGRGKSVESGATNGWSWTAGVALLLDVIDPGSARDLDRETGLNHTYLFFDVTQAKVDDFGSKKSWDLSNKDLAMAGGLMFVF
ncbi:MXAN_2562 family outer membrane beta-barrel protein [Anaeromyxobacter dehalogenans]|uniref:Outer membrane protein beta-barrel domain-containing protein n=1 Tax=Anaeromyxobacter dehalogenans (strain 2CP-C) TaxID=290397 RepID=Q2IFI6_ANADE|nr:MXAN_2562 family outer membrane beta-barrel protein [Anaeromyxobacter dehalogenans]ABC83342.1 hypothetical protein Adeh_3576 [Anaeromyxobacter dehalogenans 2CP-C]